MAKKVKKQDKPWTDKALATLDREFATCKSVHGLAKRLGRTPGGLRQKAHARGLRRRPLPERLYGRKKPAKPFTPRPRKPKPLPVPAAEPIITGTE